MGRLLGQLRRGRLHHHEYEVAALGEGPVERDFTLSPGCGRGDQLADVGGDGEMPDAIGRRPGRQQDRENDHGPSQPRTEIHDSYDY